MGKEKTEIKPNKRQQECIDNLNGAYLVLAGPGTGKTFTLIQRLKAMLNQGIPSEKILCLTFTDPAANEMRKRVEKDLGSVGVNIFTYHGFCNDIISQNPIEFELPENFQIITTAITLSLLKECIDEINPVAYRSSRNDPYVFIGKIKEGIEAIKANRLTKDDYFYNIKNNPDWEPNLIKLKETLAENQEKGLKITKKLLDGIESAKKKIAKAEELWKFYELYKSKMEQLHYVDFNDMINFVLDKFEMEPSFLHEVTNKYEYIMVDEYQDTNKNQNEIVFNLTKALDSQNVFVVGDDDQIIFSFQGARLDTIEKYLEEFPQTKVICLNENMRSTQNILDAAKSIINQDPNRLEVNPKFEQYNISKNLIAKNEDLIDKEKKVEYHIYSDIMQETVDIVEEIEKLVNSENCPIDEKDKTKKLSEIAVITRSNAELQTYAQLLKERNIQYELKEGKNIFEIKSSVLMYYYMQLLTNPEINSDKFYKIILSEPFNIHPKDFEALYKRKSMYKSIVDSIKSVPDTELIEPEKLKVFLNTFNFLRGYKNNETLKNVVMEIGSKSGIFDYYINSEVNQIENIAGLKKIVDEAIDFSSVHKKISLEEFVEYLDMTITDDIIIKTDKAPITMNAIQLSTYHSSKGREFEYVYMPNITRDKWESSNASLKPIIPLSPDEYKNADELTAMKRADLIRLLYVGMTRAKHTLKLSYPLTVGTTTKNPSSFITNIIDNLEVKKAPEYDINSYWAERTKTLLKRDYDYKKDFCSMVDNKIKGKSFSPSGINLYLKCPREYFYDYILDLETKDSVSDSLSYGSAIHTACEFAIKYALDNSQYPTKELIIEEFKKDIAKRPMSSFAQREIHIVRGENSLSELYVQLISTPISYLYKVEEPINFEVEGINFYGVIDRVDKNPDGTYSIFDYKTGKAKTAKQVCEDGEYENYYNQIGLYKYFFEKSTGKTVSQTTFIFPDEIEKNLTIDITQQECEQIKTKFEQAINNIKSYKFEPTPSETACKYCAYKEFCAMEIV